MADNDPKKIIGNRFQLVDPNKFQNQSTGLFGDPNYNISVPNEDLSIMVELVTQTKNRTLLNTNKGTNTAISTDNKKINISFIDGTTSNATGGKNFLTTSYTNMFTEMKDVEEAFGISNIDIDFNSSMAPMVNINFIDIKGAGLFQMGAKSKYSVLFRLPYPIFELTVKGFYGKPVKYCLHMLKCNTKFNSQTGNFEIAAQFVGYSYAMLTDMLVGYIKAAALTAEGKDLLKARGIISIKEFMRLVSQINGQSLGEILTDSDEDVKNLSTIEDIKKDLDDMKNLIFDVVNTINLGKYAIVEVPNTNENGVTLSQTISIVKDPNPQSNTFDDDDNRTIRQNYNTKIEDKIKAYNVKVETIEDLKITDSEGEMLCSTIETYYDDINLDNNDLIEDIKTQYPVGGDSDIADIINRLKKAATNAKDDTNAIKFTDVTDALLIINGIEQKLKIRQEELTKTVGEKIKTYVTNKLGFDTSIRSIIHLFTVHIEIFLEQLFNVSNQYDKDTARAEELKIFQNSDGAKKIDVYGKDTEKGIIYPWPEYQENGVEKYLGSKLGPLTTPLNVPEIKFTEELYEAMKRQEAAEDEMNKLEEKSKPIWLSFNPVDSWYFNQSETNPYGRLPDSANHDDFARLAVLRASGYLGFSNKFLGEDEIKSFAQQEAALIVNKLKDDKEGKILKALNLSYDTPDKYLKSSGIITDAYAANFNSTILTDAYEYHYIYPETTGGSYTRAILPVSKDFADADYKGENQFTHGFVLSNAIADEYKAKKNKDGIAYLHVLTKEEYEGPSDLVLPLGTQTVVFEVEALRKDMASYDDLKAAGFVSNNGKYGVQEFLKINHESTKDAPFFTLFYYTGNENAETYPWFVSPTLCRPRGAGTTAATQFDIIHYDNKHPWLFPNTLLPINADIIELPTTKMDSFTTGTAGAVANDGFIRINEMYNKREEIYRNVFLATDYTNTRSNVSCPFFNFNVWINDKPNNPTVANISLFGSRFYNAQTLEGKAFLFLHCFPWRGLTGGDGENGGPFAIKEILNVFINRTGFIQVPKYFPAFLGGVLKRSRANEILKFNVDVSGNTQQLIPGFDNGAIGNNLPTRDQFLVYNTGTVIGPMTFYPYSVLVGTGYMDIPECLQYLPYEAKESLIKEFDNFVTEYDTMRQSFEIIPVGYTGEGDDDSWTKAFNNISSGVYLSPDKLKAAVYLSKIEANLKLSNQKSFGETFNVFSFIANQDRSTEDYHDIFKYNYFVEYKDGSEPETKLRDAIIGYKYLSNESINIWQGRKIDNTGQYRYYTENVKLSTDNFKLYFEEFKNLVSNTVSEIQETKKFLTTDQEEIKLEIYRNLKKTYDKWIAFSDTKDKIIFQCCARGTDTSERLSTDDKLKDRRGGKEKELIDSFRFVDSFFRDIGDKFNINPFSVNQMLHDTTNVNFYSFLSRILTDNNFDFVALPTFVDFNDVNDVADIFKPYPYYEAKNIVAPSGPAFVCVYVGQTSTKLDFGEDQSSQYPNDGFDLTNDCLNCPEGVKGDSNGKGDWEDVAAAFVVRYGQQNQNFFRDVSLDQAEFGATAESLEITDALSNTLSDSNKSFYGQNLYDVYSVRSYKVEVEMMGDAMIQPMMYFQLDNMPMFHGAYLITHVKHTIKPHFMSTVFNGTRIKGTQTPLIDAAALYGALLGTFALPTSSGVLSNRTSGSYPPIVATIIGNTGQNGDIIQGNITMKKVPSIDGVDNTKSTEPKNRDSMLTEATDALEVMLKDFVTYAKTNNYPTYNKDGKTYIGIMSLFRDIAKQTELYDDMLNKKGRDDGSVAKIGRSNHGWGIAVDLQFISKSNSFITNSTENTAVGFDVNQNESLRWFLDNGYKYGFIIPWELRNSGGVEEFWHFEYHGTSAKCLYQLHPKTKSYEAKIDGDYNAIVINPLDSAKKRAVYNNCDFVTISTGDGSDSISTIGTGQKADNQVEVKKYLKDVLNYSKEAAAGVMGNIAIESPNFDPNVKPFYDTNGYYSYGLMQWNSKYTDPTAIGKTVKSQMDFYASHTDSGRKQYNDKMAEGNITAYMAGYYFAAYYERCANCTKGIDIYNSSSSKYEPSKRSKAANDFFSRFNNPADRLYWEGDGTQAAADTAAAAATAANSKYIIIGDSMTPCIETNVIKAGGKSRKLDKLWVVGIATPLLTALIKAYPVSNDVTSVVVSMGANDGYNTSTDIAGLSAQIRAKFPIADYYVVQGTWGWGNAKYKTVNNKQVELTEADIDAYYLIWKNLGFNILKPKLGKQTDKTAHDCNTANQIAVGQAIKDAGS